jgi:hypothetical protein
MAAQGNTGNLSQLASGALAGDDELRTMAQALFRDTLEQARYMIEFGTPSEKSAMAKSLAPLLMRSLQDEKADATRQAQRAAYERMKAWARGDAAVVRPENDEYPVIDDDLAPEPDPELEPEPVKPKRTRKPK